MTGVDLSALRMEPSALPKPPIGPRLLAIGALLLAIAVALTFVWPLLRPVRAVPMVAVRGAGNVAAATSAIAEAAGWVEPDPFATIVRPLVAGRIESIAVLEGSTVKAGETVIARLANAALQAQHDRATAMLAERERDLQAALAAHGFATAQLDQKAAPRQAVAEASVELADAQERLARARGEAARLRAEVQAAVAARAAQERLTETGGTYAVALSRAQAAVLAAEASAGAATLEAQALEREVVAAEQRLALAQELLANPVDLLGAAAVAAANVDKARAGRELAATELRIAERELAWTEVRAPADGIVLRLLASPGAVTGPEGDGIVSLYDPGRLRARIDVPLGSVGGIHDGQQVELRSEVLGSNVVVRGVVQRIQHESDLLKNTLQVKVGITAAPALLRPETLVRARFLGGPDGTENHTVEMTFLVPEAAVRDNRVFAFDPKAGRARALAVQVVQKGPEGVIVRGELSLAQRLITAPVQDGEAVRPESP